MESYQIICRSQKDSNFDTVYEGIVFGINQLMAKANKTNSVSLSQFVSKVASNPKILVDTKRCSYGRRAAERILNDIDKNGLENAKQEILPCQSDLNTRKEIGRIEKEFCRHRKKTKDISISNYSIRLMQEKWRLHLKQLQNPLSQTFKYFLQCLTTLDSDDRKYFLQALKLGLNERSVQHLEPKYMEYQLKQLEEEDETRDVQLQGIYDKIKDGSLGLEHFFREMATVHDNINALEENSELKDLALINSSLAEIMVDLFLEGNAIEILDGDVISVPIAWLTAVLEKIPQNKRTKLFKVSVLGAQSCGKSTLLNTVFGLNFPVSSGRCTCGAYMQLVRIDKKLQNMLGCNYLLVIDSEGLMSRTVSERSDYDNELSTFVIGLSDLTLIIVKGEGKEMQDVLPLAIHVFLRMNVVGEDQACHFVHQNMGAVDAMTKVASEIDTFVKDLNLKTLTAAKETGHSDQYKKFTHVLLYNPAKDNTYVPGLWNGTLPMGTTNVQYSNKMQSLKTSIVNCIQKMKAERHKSMTSIESFSKRLDELWRAVKYENFVFSFKNVLAVEAYTKLMRKLEDEQWELRCSILESTKSIERKIEAKVNWGRYDGDVGHLIDKEELEIMEEVSLKCEYIKNRIIHYFTCPEGCQDCDKDIQNRNLLTNCKNEFETEVGKFTSLLFEEVQSAMEKLLKKLEVGKKIKEIDNEISVELKARIDNVIKEYRSTSSTTTDSLEDMYEKCWKDETSNIQRKIKENEPLDLEVPVEAVICSVLSMDASYFMQKRQEKKLHQSSRSPNTEFFVIDYHLHLKRGVMGAPVVDPIECTRRLEDISRSIIRDTRRFYDQDTPKEFAKADAEKLFKDVKRRVKDINDKGFRPTPKYMADLFAHIEIAAVAGFKKMNDAYMAEYSPQARLQKKKEEFRIRFAHLMGREEAAVLFSKTILKKMVMGNVVPEINRLHLLFELRTEYGDMYKRVSSLNKEVLLCLLRKDDIHSYRRYISDYETSVYLFLDTEIKRHFIEKGKLKAKMKSLVERNIRLILEAVQKTVENPTSDMLFIKGLFMNLQNIKPCNSTTDMEDLKVPNAEVFGRHLSDTLRGVVRDEVLEWVEDYNHGGILDDMDFLKFVFGQIIKCDKKCPFCNAPCDDHSRPGMHSATLHCSAGMMGKKTRGFWVVMNPKLFAENCNALVASDHRYKTSDGEHWYSLVTTESFKEYQETHKSWHIDPNADPNSGKYWKRVFSKYRNEFETKGDLRKTDIPSSWGSFSDLEIENELNQLFLK